VSGLNSSGTFGYAVISVIGNEAAQVLLSANPHNDLALFIVGHAAFGRARKEMVDWLKEKYPKVKVLALNPSNSQLPSADYNAIQNGPENWLPIVSTLQAVGSNRGRVELFAGDSAAFVASFTCLRQKS